MPRHIGIILDGNRRSAQAKGISEAHLIYEAGANKLDDVLDWCGELRIRAVTLWVFSTENLNRPANEVSGIFSAIQAKLRKLAYDPEIHRRRVRVKAMGKLDLVPEPVVAAIRAAEQATRAYDAMTLTIAVAYGGRHEIVDAFRALLRAKSQQADKLEDIIDQITPEAISDYLYTAGLPDPDLIIRTSGEVRLSGFLLWQSAYSEFYFTDVNWPDFRKIDFLRAIRSYQRRPRRFGR
jgi:short-chain Z-isoprenyl diphosphate synthase